jgi:LL-diaminopimelate aminotransferase
MAGWRLGMVVGNAAALAALSQVKSNMDSGIFKPLQEAAVRALATDADWLAARNEVYQERLEIIRQGLAGVGMEAPPQQATLYVWTRVPAGWKSEEFALMLLERTGVVTAPGPFFGPSGEGYLRIAACAATARIGEAMERLKALHCEVGW